MRATIGADIAAAAVALTVSHPDAPPINVLDVMLRGHAGARLDPTAPWLQPATPFGQLLAAAFDRGMTPMEWATWTVPPADPAMRLALAEVWRDHVLEQFAERFCLVSAL